MNKTDFANQFCLSIVRPGSTVKAGLIDCQGRLDSTVKAGLIDCQVRPDSAAHSCNASASLNRILSN